MISPDTQQNVLVTVFLLISHNYLAIFFLLGLCLSTLYALVKPNRARIFLMLGFAFLLLAFEYQKHISDALLEQTKASLITQRESARLERIITISIEKIAPFLFGLSGLTSLFIGLWLEIVSRLKKGYNTKKERKEA